jgi:hypothetical protein
MKGIKKSTWVAIAAVLLLGFLGIYWLHFAQSSPLPKQGRTVEEITGKLHEVKVVEIQETIQIDGRHAVAPFKSDTGAYGISHWVWKWHEWSLEGIRTNGDPRIWKIDPSDPSSFHIIWNIDPEEQVQTIDFYLMRDRNYSVSGGEEQYFPSIRLKNGVSIQEKSYGVMKVPAEWSGIMKDDRGGNLVKSTSLFADFHRRPHLTFGWHPIDESGEDAFPESARNGSGYYSGDLNEEYLMPLDAGDVE